MKLHKYIVTSSFLLIGITSLLPVNVMAEELSAEKIIARSWQLYRQASTEKESIEVEVIQNQGRRETKSLTRWTKFDPGGEDKVTVVFSKPVMDDGLGLLTWRHPGKQDDQWLKLPSMDKVRRVSVSDQEKYFAGTDFTYEDLRQLSGERLADFIYEIIRQEDDQKVIAAVPRPGVETGYGKRLFYVNPAFVIVKMEYYSKDGRLLKSQTNSRIITHEGGMWRTEQVEVKNILLNRQTVMKVTERVLNPTLTGDIFSVRFLESKQR